MKNSQKGFILPLLAIIVVLVIGVGAYIYFNHQKAQEQSTNNKNSTTSAISTSNESTSSNYLTYTNPEIGIEFKYPISYRGVMAIPEYCFDYSTQQWLHNSTNCKGYHLSPESAGTGVDLARFLHTHTKNFSQPRGAAYDDFNVTITTKYYCQNSVSYITSCKVFTNSQGVEIAKVVIDVPYDPECIEGCWGHKVLYYAHNPNPNALFPAVLFSTTNGEKELDKIVDSFQFL